MVGNVVIDEALDEEVRVIIARLESQDQGNFDFFARFLKVLR